MMAVFMAMNDHVEDVRLAHLLDLALELEESKMSRTLRAKPMM